MNQGEVFIQRPKDTGFCKKNTLNARGKVLDLRNPAVMGILNVTPDSFYDGGFHTSERDILVQCGKMLEEGALLVDIGGLSTRPGSEPVSEKEEQSRIKPVIQSLIKNFPEVNLSIDTYRASIAEMAVNEGAAMINDISGGDFDEKMFETIARLNIPYCIMHIQGQPSNMQENPSYKDVTREVFDHLKTKLLKLQTLGVKDVLVDPGFCFGKNLEQNYRLLNDLEIFSILSVPLLVGFSRKSMINKVIKTKPVNALNGTTVLNTIALMKGASVLRVHDVKEAFESIELVKALVGAHRSV